MSALNWGMISGGDAFQSLVCSILAAEDSSIRTFEHPGRDCGQDARSEDGTHVFQMKFRTTATTTKVIQLARRELDRIREYQDPSHPNYKHWKNVNQWTLIINCTINPNDDSAWQEEVVPDFAEIGIVADYWSIETLERKIIEHPEIRDVFFNGNNRTLLNSHEAFDMISRTSPGPSFLKKPLLGRQNDLAAFSSFLEAEDKPLLVVTGPHGVGKSRFLYDSLLFAEDKGWRVFWGLAASMEASNDWFWFRNSSKPTCMFIDEVDSQDLVRRIVEQTAASERKNWKFVISIQPEHEAILPQTGFESLALNSLSEQESETLSNNCLPASHPLIVNRQAHHLYSLTQGLPAWQCLLLEECKDKRQFILPPSFPDFVGHIVKSTLDSIPADIRNHARTMLRWFAAWDVVRIENAESKELQFLAEKKVPLDCMEEVLSALVGSRLIQKWGVNGRSHAVEPAIIRQQILSDWLLEPTNENGHYRITREGQSFVRELVRFQIPNTPVVLQNLCRMSVSYLPDQESKHFLYPIFDELEHMSNGDSIKEQYGVLELLKRIGHTNPDFSLDILINLRKRELPNETVSHGLLGKSTLSHNSLLSSVCEYLFTVARDAPSADSARRFLEEIKAYLDFEKQNSVRFFNGQEPSSCLKRLIGHPRCAQYYTPVATDILREKWESLSNSLFLQTILATIWDPHRETVTSFDRVCCFQRYHIVAPEHPVWKLCLEFREKAFGTLRDFGSDKALRRELWKQLRLSVSRFDDTRGMNHDDHPAVELMIDRIRQDFQNIHEIIVCAQNSLDLEELAEARSVWAPFLNDYAPKTLSSLAKQCEDLFQRIVDWPVQAMFSTNTWDDEKPIDQIVSRLKREKSISAWESFFHVAEQYLSAFNPKDQEADVIHIYKLVEKYSDGESLKEGHPVIDFAKAILRKQSPSALEREFAIALGRCLVLQGKNDLPSFSAEKCLLPFLKSCPWKAEVLAAVYRFPHPQTIGALTESEFQFLADPRRGFSPRQRVLILASFFATDTEKTKQVLSQILADADPFSKERNELMWTITESVFMTGMRYEWNAEQIPVDWVMDEIVQLKISPSILDSRMLRWMQDKTGRKFRMEQFVQLIPSCIEQESSQNLTDRFSGFPHDFSADKWCEIGPTNSEQKAFEEFCMITWKQGSYTAIFECPEMLPKIDPDGDHISKFADSFFSNHPVLDNNELSRLAGLVTHYEEGSRGWRAVAKEICKRVASASQKDRNRVFQGFLPRRTFTNWSIGSVPKEVEDNVEAKRIRYEKEPSESPVKEYFEWSWNLAQKELDLAHQRADEERHGDL